jgi:pSer/pThr/pTyr-binding forkhead associated (FHA) protein
MNATTVTLTVLNGPLVGHAYEFHEPAVYVLGRAEECYPRLPADVEHQDVSRHHCMLSISPPEVWIQDLGSKNGTYVNGEKIGQRPRPGIPDEAAPVSPASRHQLHDGDEIALGRHTLFRVGVHVLQEVEV